MRDLPVSWATPKGWDSFLTHPLIPNGSKGVNIKKEYVLLDKILKLWYNRPCLDSLEIIFTLTHFVLDSTGSTQVPKYVSTQVRKYPST
jgi:hypothetical protein